MHGAALLLFLHFSNAWLLQRMPIMHPMAAFQAQCMPVCRFNVYVAQPEVKPGCVLRRSNVRELESRNLVDSKEVL